MYTAEQLESTAEQIRAQGWVMAADMIDTYAATLKAAQGGVAEAMVERVAKAIADAAGHGMREKCESQARAAIAALSAEPAAQGEAVAPFIVGNAYRTLAGDLVRFVSVHNEGTSYETMADEDGVCRYTRRDFGRVTGTAHDYSDPRNTPPLYTAPPAQPTTLGDFARLPDAELQELGERIAAGVDARMRQPAERVPDARIIDLAERLVASGPKAAHVSASECHEISDFILSPASPAPSEGGKGVDVSELRRAVAAIRVVGQRDSYDLIRRESVLDIIDQRLTAAQQAAR